MNCIGDDILSDELNDDFTLVNAHIGYQPDSFWSVHLYGRNILDEQNLLERQANLYSAGDSRVIGISFFGGF